MIHISCFLWLVRSFNAPELASAFLPFKDLPEYSFFHFFFFFLVVLLCLHYLHEHLFGAHI